MREISEVCGLQGGGDGEGAVEPGPWSEKGERGRASEESLL